MTPTLEYLAQSADPIDRLYVAQHPDASRTLLAVLGSSGDLALNRAVAGHPNAPLSILREIARLNDAEALGLLRLNPTWVAEVAGFAVDCGVEPDHLSWELLETLYLLTH